MARSTFTLTIAGEQAPPEPYVDQVRHVAASVNKSILPGLLDDQMNKLFVQEGTIASGVVLDVDLSASLDRFGNALALSDAALVYIENKNAATGNLFVSASASNGWTTLLGTVANLQLKPTMSMLIQALKAGELAVSPTNGSLKLQAVGADVDYVIHVWGRG